MKMVDIGKKSGEATCCPESPSVNKKNEKYYPSFYLDVVPDGLWKKDVDDEVTITVKAIIKRKSAEENDKNKSQTMSLEIREVSDDGKTTDKDRVEDELERQMGDDD